MRRFAMNRWWVLLLASVLAIGTLPGLVSPACAWTTVRQAMGAGAGTSYGDPDIPGGIPSPGRMGRTGTYDRTAGGDGRAATEMGSFHLRIMLELMRAILFR